MGRTYEEPKIKKGDGLHVEWTETHPAYAQIGASRVTGGNKVLYGSDLEHNSSIEIHISGSQLDRSLSRDDYHANHRPMITVALSEAQWATFVSSLNIGMGVPCTLQDLGGKDVPQLPNPTHRREQFRSEFAQTMQDARDKVNATIAMIREMKISEKQKNALISQLHSVNAEIGSNLDFVAEQFEAHMENVVETAKSEVHGYVAGVVNRAGVGQLLDAGARPTLPAVRELENRVKIDWTGHISEEPK